MRKKLIFSMGVAGSAIVGSCFFYFSAVAEITHPVISQVQVGGAKASDEYVEFFNPSAVAFNLNGYRLVTRSAATSSNTTVLKSWEDDVFISPYSFFLWVNAGYPLSDPVPDATTTMSITSSHYGVGLERKVDATIVDGIAWGSETQNGFNIVADAPPAPNQSLLRQDLFIQPPLFTFSTSNPRSSVSAQVFPPQESEPTPTPTPTEVEATPTPSPSPSPAAEAPLPTSTLCSMVKISEILADPAGTDAGSEAIELVNRGTQEILLDGWSLVDAGSTSHAVSLSGNTIATSSYLTVTIPATGHFTLSNTGDTVNLYCGDLLLADTQSYGSGSQEGWSWQNVNGQWMWAPATLGFLNAAPPPPASGGGGGSYSPPATAALSNSSSSSTSSLASVILISEFLPNPEGEDPGKEWVEIYNASSSDIQLQGFILDDSSSSSTPQSGSYTIENVTVPAKGYAVITIPEEKFSMNNTGQDSVRLFDKDKRPVEEVVYKDAPEGISYNRTKAGTWVWVFPSPRKENISELPDYRLAITEIFPNPDDEDEFVEIKNQGSADAPVKNLIILVGARKSVLSASQVLKPGQSFAIYSDDLGLPLSNAGQTIKLMDSYGRELYSVTYPKAPKGQSYNLTDGSYEWSAQPTPGEENILVLGESAVSAAVPSTKAKTTSKVSTVSTKELEEQNKELALKIETLQQSVNILSEQVESLQTSPVIPEANAMDTAAEEGQGTPPKNRYWYLGVSFISALLVLGAAVRYLRNEREA